MKKKQENRKGGMIQRASGVWIREGFCAEDTKELARLASKYKMHGSLQSWGETIYNMIADGAAITAAAQTSMIASPKPTLAERFWQIGKEVRITASGRISSLITTPGTARYDVKHGATVIWDGLAALLDTVAAHTNVAWKLVVELTCRAQGATGNVWGHGLWTCEDILGVPATAPKGSLSAVLPWNTPPAIGANFDTAPANILDLDFTQTAATGSMTCHQCRIESLN